MSNDFSAGQRWISDTESDLGLGTILEVEHRQITVVFLATGETRIYAKESAPLTRVAFQAGDIISSHEGWQLRVEKTDDIDGLRIYSGTREDTGEKTILNEASLDNFLQFRSPKDRLFAGLIDGQRWFALRRSVFECRHQYAQSPVRGLTGARVSVLPHQIYIAVEALKRHHPRLLLADEVGLGKTIEAGMIVHGSLANNQVSRVLIVVPSALLHQWLVEMLRKFNLNFRIMDAERFDELRDTAPDGNPFLAEQLVLCSLDTLLENEEIGDAVAGAGWDMLVADEAHHLSWEPEEPSDAYTLIEELAMETPAVLLLTATPEQLGQAGHFARLRLLDPERFGSLEQYLAEESSFGWVASVADKLAADEPLDEEQIVSLQTLLGEEFTDNELKTLSSTTTMALSDLGQRLIGKLVDRHGTGRLMFRNTRRAITGFPERELHTYTLDDDSLDSKAVWILEFLLEQYPEKVLVICSSRDTVQELAEHLRVAGVQSAQFHEDMSIVERDRAAAWFSDPEEDCRLMLCSEIGSEGRNFQFLHHLVMLELPQSPDLLEQRIGRLDRIGQTETIKIHVPAAPGTQDSLLLSWYHEGLNAFERICRSGSAVRARIADQLEPLLAKAEAGDNIPEKAIATLIQESRQLTEQLDAELESGRDRLLELNSNRPELIQEHLDELARLDRNYALQDFMEAVFDRFGVDMAEQRDHWIIHPSDHMQVDHFPLLPASGMTLTFDRATALTREDFTYLTWDHPMVTAAMDLILDEGFGQADCQVIKTDALPANLSFVEASYVLQCTADARLNMERYLPAQVQTWSVGIDGKDYSEQVAALELDSLKQRYDRNALRKVVLKNRDSLEKLIDRSAALAEEALPELVAIARAKIDEELSEARERLLSLSRVNPSVKEEEVRAVDERHQALIDALDGTHARPVSARVMFNT
ncbi:RNA polymerase-associated protein RapA [Granulosicoccus antarcticus]|uniref:RNA polymerase-associated protein RapA n=1 Tax=Granulosicoccus antarcticus IMCC3135 TaxID=1192854 RepID=A0A2Z2NYK7_9GAMM|nr:RNA polymerase-associated protein RapA [Granulosicoccus antarcticus]ASJ75525.1 RNA polymerase-associated protein RapA [Granulosicoccus antarcticus IMCC3135]